MARKSKSATTAKARSEEPMYTLSPYMTSSFPLGTHLHFLFHLRHRNGRDEVLFYYFLEWDQRLLDAHVIPLKKGRPGASGLESDAVTARDFLALAVRAIPHKLARFLMRGAALEGQFIRLRTAGALPMLFRALAGTEPGQRPFHVRAYADTIFRAFEQAHESRDLEAFRRIAQSLENREIEPLSRPLHHLQPDLLHLQIVTAALKTHGDPDAYPAFLMFLERSVDKKNRPEWLDAFLQHEKRETAAVLLRPTLPPWDNAIRLAMLCGWWWRFAIDDPRVTPDAVPRDERETVLQALVAMTPGAFLHWIVTPS